MKPRLLFLSLTLALAGLVAAGASSNATFPRTTTLGSAGGSGAAVPDSVAEDLRIGRYWHASVALRRELGNGSDPPAVLRLAEAEAGWHNWSGVLELLEGEAWLATVEGGRGVLLLARALDELGRSEKAAEAYARWLALPGAADGKGSRVPRIRRAMLLARLGRGDDAMAEMEAVRGSLSSFGGSWAHLALAGDLAEAGDTSRVRTITGRISEGDALERARLLLPEAYLAAGDSAGAEASLAGAVDAVSDPGRRGAAFRQLGRLRLARRDSAGARAAFEASLDASRRGPPAVDAARRLLALGRLDADRLRQVAEVLAGGGETGPALDAYDRLAALPGQVLDDETRLARARLLAGSRRLAEAVTELTELGRSSDPDIGGPALDRLADVRGRQGRGADRTAVQNELVERFPSRPEAVDVVFFRGDDAQDAGRLTEAAEHYRKVAGMSPALDRAGLARMRLGQIHIGRGDHGGAAEVFEGYLDDFPDGRRWDEASYWAARSRLETGDSAGARGHLARIREKDPVSYYAVLSAQLLDEPFAIPVASTTGSGEGPPPAWMAGLLDELGVFREAGLDAGAAATLERLTSRAGTSDEELFRLAEELGRRGEAIRAINLGWQLRRAGRPWDRRLLRIIYPFPYRELVLREAREWQVDPFLVAALIRQESAFLPGAVSSAGAVGLMQVMPATGEELARRVGPRGFTRAHLTSPEVSLHLGSRFLTDMLGRYQADLPLVLSAYNAGPTRANRWRNLPEARDPVRFTERIPFAETRGYVKNVTRNLHLYTWLYGADG